MKLFYLILFFICITSCNLNSVNIDEIATPEVIKPNTVNETSLIVLGTIQDAGSPHIGCKKKCCEGLFNYPDKNRKVVSLGLIDAENNKKYLFEATPDITSQLAKLKEYATNKSELPDGIFLTHAHIGHYSGLMYLGKEATNAKETPVYAMPKMKTFLEQNGPWSQLVINNNISILPLGNKQEVQLTNQLKVIPFKVPHRDEYSETVGYKIIGPNKTVLFIPDIDKWEKWETLLIEELKTVDYAFLDATFYDGEEINNRDISEIPHPFIIETMDKLKDLSATEKNKVYFIHFNHTNPAININSDATQQINANGFNISYIYDVITL